jgi:hypothetical protein
MTLPAMRLVLAEGPEFVGLDHGARPSVGIAIADLFSTMMVERISKSGQYSSSDA